MKSKQVVVIGFMLFTMVFLQPTALADEKIDVYGFFTWMQEDGSWHSWINCSNNDNQDLLHLLGLEIGQSVKCKIIIIPHEKCTIAFSLHEPGVTKAFDVISGAKHDESLAVMKDGICLTDIITHDIVEPKVKIEYTWILKANSNWTGGNAPLQGYWIGNFYSHEERTGWINFVEAYMLNEKWDGPNNTIDNDVISNENVMNANGFEIILCIFSVIILIGLKRKK